MTKKLIWAVMVCESCQSHFAAKEITRYTSCPQCASEDVTNTGEFLDSTLYLEDGREIK